MRTEQLAIPPAESSNGAGVDGATYSSVALQLPADLTFEEWVRIGMRVGRLRRSTAWILGDWARFGEHCYGARYADAVELTGLEARTLANYAWVAGRFPPARRRAGLSLQHHASVVALPEAEQDAWLERAEANSWPVRELRDELAGAGVASTVDVGHDASRGPGANVSRSRGRRRLRPAASAYSRRAVVRLSLDESRVDRWRAAAQRDGKTLAGWIADSLDELAGVDGAPAGSTRSL